jgi:hypothetical protein
VNWLQSWLLVVISVMELSWLYPWLAFLGRALTGYERALGAGVAWGIFFGALAVTGLLSRWRIASRYQRIVVGGLVLLTVLLMIRTHVYPTAPLLSLGWIGTSLTNFMRLDRAVSRELFLVLATFGLWWRAIGVGQQLLIADVVGFRFRLGILLLVALLVAQALSYRQDMTGWMLSLFMSGLVSVALARLKESAPASQEARRFSLRWLLSLVAGAGGTLLLGLLVSAALAAENLATLWRWVQPLVVVLATVIFYVGYGLAYVLAQIIIAILRLVSPDTPGDLPLIFLSPLESPVVLMQPEEAASPTWGRLVLQGAVALVLVGLFVLLLLAVRRLRPQLSGGPDVWRESVWSSREVGRGLLAGLRGSLRQLAGLWPGREARRAYSAATVRQIYASLLVLAEERGAPRPPEQTPFEYLPALQTTFPGWQRELRTLTGAYVDAHYGRLPDTEAELQALRDAWQRICAWVEAQLGNKTTNN